MKDCVYLGPTPPEEDCVQLGEANYNELAFDECRRYIELIRKKLGHEPAGAKLKIKWSPHDFGSYAEVVCEFECDNNEAETYALNCDNNGPLNWEDGVNEND